MKLLATALLLFATAASGETKIDVVTGCEIKPIQNSNAWQFVDPHCQGKWAARTGNEGSPDSDFPVVDEEEGEAPA